MSTGALDFGVAAGIAVVISVVELQSSLTKPLSFERAAVGWLVLRLILDASTSAVCLMWVIPLLDQGQPWFTGIGPAVVAGVGGPVIFRTQLATLKNGKEFGALGFGRIFVQMRKGIDSSLDDVGAVAQSTWVTVVAMPALQRVGLREMVDHVRMYIQTLDRMTEADKKKHISFVQKVLDDNSSDEEKKRAILQTVLDIGGRRLIKKIVAKQVAL
jgi:hypothetical protein